MTAHAEQEELRVRLERRSAAEADMALRLETAELRAAAAAEAKARAAATVRSWTSSVDCSNLEGAALDLGAASCEREPVRWIFWAGMLEHVCMNHTFTPKQTRTQQ